MGSELGDYRDTERYTFIYITEATALIIALSASEGVACRQPAGNAHENNRGSGYI